MKAFQRFLPWISAGLCVVLLVLLAVDAVMGDRSFIFNSGFVKALTLITCLCAAVCGGMLSSRNRRRSRR